MWCMHTYGGGGGDRNRKCWTSLLRWCGIKVTTFFLLLSVLRLLRFDIII